MAGMLERNVCVQQETARGLNPIYDTLKKKVHKIERKKEDICPNHSEQVFFPRPNSQPLGLPANFTSLSHLLFSSFFVSQFLKVRDNHHGGVILAQFGSYKKKENMGSASRVESSNYDYSFKVLLIGDSGVGKSSLLLSFISNSNSINDLSPTIGVDFKIKLFTVGGKRLKLTIWDTVYDVTRRETFTNLIDIWAKEVERYSTNHGSIKILVGNKVDKDSERAVSKEEGMALAQQHRCLFLECSAKTRENVQQCFNDLTLKILDVPGLREKGSVAVKRQKQKHIYETSQSAGCCS
ncbi:Ras-related protein RABC2a [Glycine max]|nr:Ras-related protein RABC2a [Glycine max]